MKASKVAILILGSGLVLGALAWGSHAWSVAHARRWTGRQDVGYVSCNHCHLRVENLTWAKPRPHHPWIYRDIMDSDTNWGIYHRQINASAAGLPANSIGFIGGGSYKLQAYVGLADGSAFFAGEVTVGGAIVPSVGNSDSAGIQFPKDPAGGSGDRAFIRYFVESGESTKLLIGNNDNADDRISLYQMGAERLTVYNGCVGINTATPGAALDVNGVVVARSGLNVNGATAHIDADGALYRNVDGQVYLTVDDNFFFRDVGSSTWAAHVDTNSDELHVRGMLRADGAWVLVNGAGNELACLGGDGFGGDVQIGSAKSEVTTVSAWNISSLAYMDIACRAMYNISDERAKRDIRPVKGGVAKISCLDAISFEWSEQGFVEKSSRNLGLVAQQVRQVVPEAVVETRGMLTLSYPAITALLVEAVKEQQQQIEELRAQLVQVLPK